MKWQLVVLAKALILGAPTLVMAQTRGTLAGFLALSGAQARGYLVPDDMQLVRSGFHARDGLRWVRYLQVQRGIPVLGAEITVHRDQAADERVG